MSWALFKVLIKKNGVLWLIFTAVIVFYLIIIIMTKELLDDVMGDFTGLIPGFTTGNILTYTSTVYFTSVINMFPMVFYVMVAYKLVAKAVDNTSMSTYLSSGISRTKYIITAATFLLASIFVMFAIVFGVGCAAMSTVEAFSVVNFINVVGTSMLCTMMLAMASFFAGAFFSGSKLGLGLGIAIPAGFLIIFMLADAVAGIEWLKWLQYVTPFGWPKMAEIAAGTFNLWWLVNLGYLVATGVLFFLSVFLFKRKQLSI